MNGTIITVGPHLPKLLQKECVDVFRDSQCIHASVSDG